MKKLFDGLTTFSSEKPKTSLGIMLLFIIALTPNAMFINFDNSEDAFFPDNETVQLLNEVEEEYQASIDIIRFIDDIESGDLHHESTWEQLAILESLMLENTNLRDYQYPLFGTQANSGMASSAIQWQRIQDPISAESWLDNLSSSVNKTIASDNETISSELTNLTNFASQIPGPVSLTHDDLRNWTFQDPGVWLDRFDAKLNLTLDLELIIGRLLEVKMIFGDEENISQIDAVITKLTILRQLQEIDYHELALQCLPVRDRETPWESSGPVITSFVVVTEPKDHGVEIIDEVQEKITRWADELQRGASDETGDSEISVFSFSQLATGQNANLGKELGILNSLCLLLLGFILWTKFRSKRDTANVLILTVLAIISTYGTAGLLTTLGVNLVFNAAMNSIPILLLAIGVDYGLHVVARIREELQDQESKNPLGRNTLRDFSTEARRLAIRRGTILTSAALMVAIVTDIVGFLSFRFSSQQFLVSFGTVIAIGLFFIYLLSITALPALLMLIPPKNLPLDKSGKNEIGPISEKIGSITKAPWLVVFVTILISIPMFYGFNQLDVGFDTRENFDESVPVVQDFFVIADEFRSSPAPLYVVLDGDIITADGRGLYDAVISDLETNPSVTDTPVGIWSILEKSRATNALLDSKMSNLSVDESSYIDLKNWLMTEIGRNITSGNLNRDASQTIISFQAATLDWQATSDFETELNSDLTVHIENDYTDYDVRLSGRSLILAQITADVAESAIISTATVASVILMMLIGINSVRQRNVIDGVARGFVTWVPLMVVVVWVYGIMGLTGYQLNSQSVTIGALTLGLGVDYAVHLTTRLEEEVEHNPSANSTEWTTKSAATTGRAMFGAALTTAGGFSVLNLSSLVPLQLFGQVFVVAIILALISSLMVLPALYTPFLKRDAAKILAESIESE
tara:strand:+ start:5297 stop:8062 length:2766 start_codon:yes stop_codon:yes gene_type:complete